jgi:hypothetical protein
MLAVLNSHTFAGVPVNINKSSMINVRLTMNGSVTPAKIYADETFEEFIDGIQAVCRHVSINKDRQ